MGAPVSNVEADETGHRHSSKLLSTSVDGVGHLDVFSYSWTMVVSDCEIPKQTHRACAGRSLNRD